MPSCWMWCRVDLVSADLQSYLKTVSLQKSFKILYMPIFPCTQKSMAVLLQNLFLSCLLFEIRFTRSVPFKTCLNRLTESIGLTTL
jgi:hypothetical protein